MKHMIHRHWRLIFLGITLLVDASAVVASSAAAYYLWYLFPNFIPVSLTGLANITLFYTAVFLSMATMLGLYRSSYHSTIPRQYFLAGKTYIYSTLIILSFLYAIRPEEFPRKYTLFFLFVLPLFFSAGRMIMKHLNSWCRRFGYGTFNSLLMGYENGGVKIFERFKGFPELGYELKGAVHRNGVPHERVRIHGVEIPSYRMKDLDRVIDEQCIDRIFIPSPAILTDGYADVLRVTKKHYIKLKVLSGEADMLLRTANIYDISGITIFSPPRRRVDLGKRIVKRMFDLAGAAALLIVLSPVFLIAAASIAFESGFPILYKQRRTLVRGGRTFHLYKYRSMIKNADEMKQSLFDANESSGPLFKIKNDPRMTKVGRIIRKFSVDELPQLLNVLKGEMSLVGPRPLPVTDYEKVDRSSDVWEYMNARGRVKPGMTGLWQVSGRSNLGFREMVWLDLYYVENQSLLFDLEIIFATLPVVLFGKGAY